MQARSLNSNGLERVVLHMRFGRWSSSLPAQRALHVPSLMLSRLNAVATALYFMHGSQTTRLAFSPSSSVYSWLSHEKN